MFICVKIKFGKLGVELVTIVTSLGKRELELGGRGDINYLNESLHSSTCYNTHVLFLR